ncbi:MAG: M20/M25/M40 family metallo-hydrolase [Candidatus Hodarchaeales archaeon]|jgi:acetylornithine deacetylase/succinyl-diaminopimelate desuccinylase-like protein
MKTGFMLTLQNMTDFIENNNKNAIEDLFKLVKLPTVTAKGGEYSYLIIDELTRIFKELDFQIEIHETEGQPVFTATLDSGKKKTLLFYNHYDVQPAEPLELWKSPAFEPEIRDGKIWGRGVADNKGEIIVRASAIKMLQELTNDVPVNIKFIIEGEEEVSSPNLGEFVQNNLAYIKNSDGCIWEFGGSNAAGFQEIWAGVKGICYIQLKTTGSKKDLHSALGVIIENPANHLIAALASLRDDKNDKILLKGHYDSIIKPSKEFLEKISRIAHTFDEDKQKEQWGVDSFIQNLSGFDLLKKWYLEPTCTICGIWSGWQGEGSKTVLPSVAQAKVDFRLVPNQTPQTVVETLKQHFKDNGFNVEIEWWKGYPAAYTPISDPFIAIVEQATSEIYNHSPLVHPWNPGSGPLYLFADHVPTVSIGVGNAGSAAHSPNENILVSDFKQGQLCIARIIEKM